MRYEATRASRASAAAWLRSSAGRSQSFDLGQPSDRSEGSGAATQRNQAPPGPIHLPESFGGSAEGSVAVGGGRRTEDGAYGPSQTHGLESPCHVAWAFQPMSGRQRIAGRVELRTRSGSGRTAGGGAYGPPQTHGLESPWHVAWAFQPMSGRQRIAGRVELRTRSGSRPGSTPLVKF